eukprot:scaffold39524_cov78-Phaeocystis_antarctica.AAC.2
MEGGSVSTPAVLALRSSISNSGYHCVPEMFAMQWGNELVSSSKYAQPSTARHGTPMSLAGSFFSYTRLFISLRKLLTLQLSV